MAVYLSASSIKDFIKCSQKVYYRFSKEVEAKPSREMLIGTLLHTVLERGWRTREVAIEMASTEAKMLKLPSSDLNHVMFMVDIFFLNFRQKLTENDKIEYRFKLPLYDDVFLVGKMDRITGGGVLDWKTDSKPPKSLTNDIQSIIYEFAYEKIFGNRPTSVCIASLTKGTLIPYVRSDMLVKEVFDRIIPRMIKTVKAESYERMGLFNHGCFRCPYREGCLGKRVEYELDSPDFTDG